MRNYAWKIIVVAFVILVCSMGIFPPREKLKLGKDLAGGVTLTYTIAPDDEGRLPSEAEVSQIVTVLMERIDPNGVYDIAITPQGRNQLEISMPLPTPDVIAKRDIFEAKIDALAESSLGEGEIENALRLSPEERATTFAELARGVEERAAALAEAAAAADRAKAAEDAYRQIFAQRTEAVASLEQAVDDTSDALDAALTAVRDAGVPDDRVTALTTTVRAEARDELIAEIIRNVPAAEFPIMDWLQAQAALDEARAALQAAEVEWMQRLEPTEEAAARAQLDLEEAVDAVEATSLSADSLRLALELDPNRRTIRNPLTGELETVPSPREQALDRIKTQFPVFRDEIDDIATAYDAYKSLSKGYDDPKELIGLLRGAGVLHFRIAVDPTDPLPISELREEIAEKGPRTVQAATGVGWYAIDSREQWYDDPQQAIFLEQDPARFFLTRNLVAEEYDGQIYLLLYTDTARSLTEANGDWSLTGASPGTDQLGRPAVNFQLDPRGGQLFGRMTGDNIGRPMAIVLDDRVFSAPNLQSQINNRGQITGRFSQADIEYLLKVLNAGSLQNRVVGPIGQNSIGPELGGDNLQRGIEAGIISIIVVAAFMVVYYFFAGVVANVALLCNGIIILGVMSWYQAAFTMPGIAGIVLTFGMAVDANVLIYERIREELRAGADLKTAIRLGYDKALSTIIDGNVTNLIVCVVLAYTATVEVKGFALTLGIGIVGTLFSALFITRLIFDLYARYSGATSLPMLPLVWNGLERALNPSIQWTKYRYIFWTSSSIIVLLSIVVTWSQWDEMLDTEFSGGSSVVFSLREDPETGEQLMLPRQTVEDRIEAWAAEQFAATAALADSDPRKITEAMQRAFLAAGVLNYNIDQVVGADFRGSQFVVKTGLEDPSIVERAITEIFAGELDQEPPLSFQNSDALDPAVTEFNPSLAPVFPILDPVLGANINDPTANNIDDRRFLGGVAIVLRDIEPAVSLDALEDRIERTRSSPEFADAFGRPTRVIGLTPAEGTGGALWRDVVVLVRDDSVDLFSQRELWEERVQELEWTLVHQALTEPPSLEQVTKIEASIASQFRQQAIVAIILSLIGILVYVWFRFGSFRYSAAAIIALIHDVIVTLGLLSLTHLVYTTAFARWFYIEPFKIDLGVVAALLTIIGYSLNDTIVILDRVRENRGKLPITTATVVDASINQTLSRTFLTSGTTLIAVIIMYWEGGTGIRPFTFAMLCGIVVGTYSTIGIASPMVFSNRLTKREQEDGDGGGHSTAGGSGTNALARRK